MIRALIYDFDGTLADTFSSHLKAYAFALSKFKIKATRDEIIKNCFNKLDEQAAKSFGIQNRPLFSKYYREGVLKALQKTKLYPHVVETLAKIKMMGIFVGVATARNRKEITKTFSILKLGQYMDSVVTHDDVTRKKPHPEIFMAVCSKLGVGMREVIVIGDADVDMAAANAMRAKSVLFYPDDHREFYKLSELKKFKPAYIIKDNIEILKVLKKLESDSKDS